MKTNINKFTSAAAALLLIAAASGTVSCGVSGEAKEHKYASFSVKQYLGVEFPEKAFHFGKLGSAIPTDVPASSNYLKDAPNTFLMKVYGGMNIYETITSPYPYNTLADGTLIVLTEPESSNGWATVRNTDGVLLGYAKDGFLHSVSAGSQVYAELPIEYGTARTANGDYIDAYSHLVDVRKYLRVYASTDPSNRGVDLSEYDVKVSMKLSTDDTSINEPFYSRNLCLMQYDTLQKFMKAVEIFKADGYTVVIYDAYRPTSVQQRWFDVVKVHKWVANPDVGMGGVHDRGTAIDMSLIDAEGNELEMPTPMHTFTEESARASKVMTETARANMDYMTRVMLSCGFTYINSEWWHFQCVNTKNYLPTDHPIDSIPLVPSENLLAE